MNYAWEAVLQAEKHNRERDNLRFVEASTPSPYIEVSVIDLNQDTKDGFYITEDGHKIRTEIQGQDSRLDAAQKIYDDFTAK